MDVARRAKSSRSAISASIAARSASESGVGGFVVVPFLGGFVQRLVVLSSSSSSDSVGSCFCSLALSRFEIDVSAPAMANVEEASSLRRTSVISVRWLAGSAWRFGAAQIFRDEFVEPVFAFFRA